MKNKLDVLSHTYEVRTYQVDPQGYMHPAAICSMFQEIAGEHARLLGWGYHSLKEQNMAWMLSRLSMQLHARPIWQSMIRIDTWVRKTDRLFSYRDFELYNHRGELMVSATTAWLLLNMESRRLQRVDVIREHFAHFPQKIALCETLDKLPAVQKGLPMKRYQVRYSELDMVGHANNVSYLQWLLDAFSPQHLAAHSLQSLQINYLNEAKWEDEIRVSRDQHEPIYEISRTTDEQVLCRARLEWEAS
ncbi:MAG: hypothetical protein D6730_18935 [Bacteroidetes bacterium]|nr:MAG: hypothetical protein D6730_18935 [Bacteroidota bacterium]